MHFFIMLTFQKLEEKDAEGMSTIYKEYQKRLSSNWHSTDQDSNLVWHPADHDSNLIWHSADHTVK